MSMPENCRRCGRQFHDQNCIAPMCEHRQSVRHKRRGLCSACARHATEDGSISFYPLTEKQGRPRSYLTDEFDHFITGRRTTTRLGWDSPARRAAAIRLGVTAATLDRALYRRLKQREADAARKQQVRLVSESSAILTCPAAVKDATRRD